jgi:hypothetical protein
MTLANRLPFLLVEVLNHLDAAVDQSKRAIVARSHPGFGSTQVRRSHDREALQYLVQLRNLYVVRFGAGHDRRTRYRRVSEADLTV